MQPENKKLLLIRLGEYMLGNADAWEQVKENAYRENNWFIPEFVNLSVKSIARNYLQSDALEKLIDTYHLPNENPNPKQVGIVMAGNIPLVGFHDFLCVFITGN